MSSPGQDPSSPTGLVGQTIAGRFKVISVLGEGGMGIVYLGEQKLGTATRKVAIKTLHQHLSHDPKVLARFERECATIAELQHPNTIQVYDFGKTDDGTLYIVMEFVEGRSVADVLEKDGPMAPARVEKILTQIVGSLEEAHGRDIVHRDLKPENIVLCDRAGQKDWVEVLDFGIAKRKEEDKDERKLTQAGMVLGTPPYMSPEQFTGRPIDSRSDIYSLGVMSYEMLTGRLPFHGDTAYEWATQHMTVPPAPIETQPMGDRVPATMKHAITRALAKDPDQRFPSVRDYLDAFTGKAGAPTAHDRPHTTNSPVVGSVAGGPPMDDVGQRGRTEMGAAVDPSAFGAPAASPYGAPPPMQSPPMPYAASPVPAYTPPPPSVGSDGGGKKTGLIVAALLGVLVLCGVAVAFGTGMFKGSDKPADSNIFAGTTTPPPTTIPTEVPATATETATATTPPIVPTLTHETTTKPTPKPAAKDAGVAAPPASTATPTLPTGPAPTPPPPPKTATPPPPPSTGGPPECAVAKTFCSRQDPTGKRLCETNRRICLSKGGTVQ